MKIERKIAEQIKAVMDGYEEQIVDYANRNDQKNTRYVNGVRRGFCRALQMLDISGVEVDRQPVVRNGMPVDCVTFDVDRASVEPDPRDWTEREILNVISNRCKELEDYVETHRICAHKVLSAGAKKMMSGLMAKLGKVIEYCEASFSLSGDDAKEK